MAEVPGWAMTSPQTFCDWVMNSTWRSLQPLMVVSCPLCASLVVDDWNDRLAHTIWHVPSLFGEAGTTTGPTFVQMPLTENGDGSVRVG